INNLIIKTNSYSTHSSYSHQQTQVESNHTGLFQISNNTIKYQSDNRGNLSSRFQHLSSDDSILMQSFYLFLKFGDIIVIEEEVASNGANRIIKLIMLQMRKDTDETCFDGFGKIHSNKSIS
ncbi:hypothetical protein BpHYR1_051701, partial [Brachionus plicatilis]